MLEKKNNWTKYVVYWPMVKRYLHWGVDICIPPGML